MSVQDRDELFGIPDQLVMDPVHGGIAFFPHEEAVIDHPIFQRLRWIVQNDVTSLVFPGATHSRFQHSQGAMHISGRLWKSMVRGYLADPKIQRRASISERQARGIRYFYYCLRLAALLHDTGHFPFSHQLESSSAIKEVLKRPDVFKRLWNGINWKRFYRKIPVRTTHEHYSVRCAYEILSTCDAIRGAEIEPIDVIALMETTTCKPSKRFQDAAWDAFRLLVRSPDASRHAKKADIAEAFKSFLQTVISGELDVDKMDYLLRDSFYSGCHYGVYNLDHLLSTIRIGFSAPDAKTWVGMAITDKGVVPLEDFVYARFQLYQDLYSHKTVVGFKWLLAMAVNELMANDRMAREFAVHALSDISVFKDFTDTFLWERLRDYARAHSESAAAQLVSRQRLEHLLTRTDMVAFEKERMIADLKRRNKANVISYESPISFSKMSKPYEKIRVLHYDPLEDRRSLEAINRHTTFFEKFHDLVITHFYLKPVEAQPKKNHKVSPKYRRPHTRRGPKLGRRRLGRSTARQ